MPRFTQPFHITRDHEVNTVRVSIATSEGRVDEVTLTDRDFRDVARALWDRAVFYVGTQTVRAKYKEGYFSLSVQTGIHTRTVYRLEENDVMPVLGQYMAQTGGE